MTDINSVDSEQKLHEERRALVKHAIEAAYLAKTHEIEDRIESLKCDVEKVKHRLLDTVMSGNRFSVSALRFDELFSIAFNRTVDLQEEMIRLEAAEKAYKQLKFN